MEIREWRTTDNAYVDIRFVKLTSLTTPEAIAAGNLSSFGRMAIIPNSKSLWIGEEDSDFPRRLLHGYYWAVENGTGNVLVGMRTPHDDYDYLLDEDNALLPELTTFLEAKGLITYRTAEERA